MLTECYDKVTPLNDSDSVLYSNTLPSKAKKGIYRCCGHCRNFNTPECQQNPPIYFKVNFFFARYHNYVENHVEKWQERVENGGFDCLSGDYPVRITPSVWIT